MGIVGHKMHPGPHALVPPLGRSDALSADAQTAPQGEPVNPRLEKRLKDYASGGLCLLWKRQSMYLCAALLAGLYIDAWLAVICLILCELCEFLDYRVSMEVMNWEHGTADEAVSLRRRLLVTSVLSALAVSAFCVGFAVLEGRTTHQLPLFILFAAGLFAAVNNHQLPQILHARLFIYGASFLFIPILDLAVVRPPLSSPLWLQLATVLFVLYFVIECAQIFLQIYRKGLDQLDALRQERDRAQKAYEIKSQFVSTVSHELRTPLTSIKGALDLLHSGALDPCSEKARRITDIARNNSVRLKTLIEDLLDLQKLEAGELVHDKRSIDLNQVARDAIRSVNNIAESKGIDLVTDLSEEPLFVHGDPKRLEQVFVNLLSNGIKFSHDSSVVKIHTGRKGDRVVATVSDSGIGIPDGAEEIVFGRFGQVDGSDNRQHEGTGLGLSIVKQIMQTHRGDITYKSVEHEGTTFTLSLPQEPC